jgi:hypothetical protein
MPDRNVRTNLQISAETKGFDEAQRKASGVNQLVSDSLAQQAKGFAEAEKQGMAFQRAVGRLQKTFGDTSTAMKSQIEGVMANFDALGSMDFRNVQTHIESLEDDLQNLAREQVAVSDVMERMTDKTGDAYKNLKNHMKELNDESRRITGTINNLNKAFSEQAKEVKEAAQAAEQSQGAFTQGFLQAALPWPAAFLQRGPGMRRQMLGMATGGLARAGIAGLGAAFTGVQGLQRGAASIPLAGGFISGQLGSAAGYAEQALQWQQMRRDLLPLLGSGFGASAGLRQAEQRLRIFEQEQKQTEQFVRLPEKYRTREIANRPDVIWTQDGDIIPMKSDLGREIVQNIRRTRGRLGPEDIVTRPRSALLALSAQDPREITEQRAEINRERRRLRQNIQRQQAMTPFGQLLGQGRGLGLNRMELMQRISPILQIGGGGLGEAAGQGLTQAALAAQTLFGVGPEVSGAFLRAGRRGGLVGGQGRAGQSLVEAIQGARELGLERAEIPQYLQIIANGIQQWQITGIPVNEKSLKTIALEVEKAGISAPRALQISQGIQQYVQNIGARGIRGGLDILLLQQLGGFRGGGAGDLEQAMIRMETMRAGLAGGVEGIGPESGMGETMRFLMEQGGGGAMGRRFLRTVLQRMGVQTSALEVRALAGRLTGEELLTPEQRQTLETERERRRAGVTEAAAMRDPQSLMKMAMTQVAQVSPHLEKQAGLLEKQLEVGNRMITTVTRLERSALQTTNAFTQLVEEPLKKFSGALENITKKLETITASPNVFGSLMSLIMGS